MLYRGSVIGVGLTDALDSMQEQNLMSSQMADKVLETFDQVILAKLESLGQNQKSVANIKGPLYLYRFCSDVWTFIFKNASIKVDGEYLHVNYVKIVAMDCTKIAANEVDEGKRGEDPEEEQIQRIIHSGDEYFGKEMRGAMKVVSGLL